MTDKRSNLITAKCYMLTGETVMRANLPHSYSAADVLMLHGRYYVPTLARADQYQAGVDIMLREVRITRAQDKENSRAGRRETAEGMLTNYRYKFEETFARKCVLHDDVLFCIIEGMPTYSSSEEQDDAVIELMNTTDKLWSAAGVVRT